MKRLFVVAASALMTAGFAQSAFAVDVSRQVTTKASPEAVWSIIGAFPDIATWLPGVASSPADKGSQVGSVRVITLKAPGSPTVTETLTKRNEEKHSYSYAITKVDPKVLPVSDYTSTISVKPHAGGGSVVMWRGHFKTAGGGTDADSTKAVGGLYMAGLDHIKSLAETN